MGEVKIIISDEVEQAFRKNAMESYGYARGAISAAAEEALKEWTQSQGQSRLSKDPVKMIDGLLSHVKKKSVTLQHEAPAIRSRRHVH